MSNVKKCLVVFALCALIVLSASNVFATGLIQITGTEKTSTVENTVVSTNTVNPTSNTVVSTNTINTVNAVNATTNDETLPKTGTTEDYAIFALIGVGVVLSVITYNKIKAYNNI